MNKHSPQTIMKSTSLVVAHQMKAALAYTVTDQVYAFPH